jgi:hypothetical protein
VALVTDNAANMSATARLGGSKTHTLKLRQLLSFSKEAHKLRPN